MGYELGHRQLERLTTQLERQLLGEVLLPVDAVLVLLGLELGRPLLAVEVKQLVEREPIAVLEDPPVGSGGACSRRSGSG